MSDAAPGGSSKANRVRKRVPNACNFCKRQKIRCSGNQPCAHCEKRKQPCTFPEKQQQVLVFKETLARLQRDASRAGDDGRRLSHERHLSASPEFEKEPQSSRHRSGLSISNPAQDEAQMDHSSSTPTSQLGIDQPPGSRYDESRAASVHSDSDRPPIINPLVSGQSTYTGVNTGRALHLGSSSNWSFGRRALALAHSKVFGYPLPETDLHHDGTAYDLGWDGRRTAAISAQPALPTADHALFLINTVKFHCGQLFHVFDNDVFMQNFNLFHEGNQAQDLCPELWYIHYLIVLAIGKSLVGRLRKGRKPSGADLFVRAMQILPDQIFLWTDPVESTEILCCAALYLQCLDMRIVAYTMIGQAIRTAISFGFHTDMPLHQHSAAVLERCRKIWWTVYILDSHMSALMGAPRAIDARDINAQLPTFGSSIHKVHALHIHIKLADIEGMIQQTVYSKEGRTGINFLNSIKAALKALAAINDERTSNFPLELGNPGDKGISRLSAHLHLFHHHCIILNTKPLLFSFLQRRVETLKPIRVPSSGGVRSLLRVCVGSARQTTKILAALQSQTLLDVFVPFDLESTWSAALVLLIAPVVDPSLFKDNEGSLQTALDVLNEMASTGNSIASFRKDELSQLRDTLKSLELMEPNPRYPTQLSPNDSNDAFPLQPYEDIQPGTLASMQSEVEYMSTHSFDMEEVLSSEQLEAVANAMNLNGLDWTWAASSMDQLEPSLL
ncbi:Zn(II)2Cys6 transcription factor [Boeremia exigua]|uniref:Zn(II)2Cys6 transcription factor n=1 Tax=Boeremia exigua TaxID=749465 RepID=UPI001E8CF0F3|nr:Zn(II)2Cys6 transcription factor [Boeremia exigua]KAH6612413.1 Zn(II)2Cys6 transcription factor [Boeremia exigua]